MISNGGSLSELELPVLLYVKQLLCNIEGDGGLYLVHC